MNVWETYRTIHGGDHHPDLLTVVHNLGGTLSQAQSLCCVPYLSLLSGFVERLVAARIEFESDYHPRVAPRTDHS